ncbi:hypothetical protein HS088_TW21G01562 [Tripterygium wilfordii]|uniref:GIR1-like zinc ribbon domain-containing protein n=1 Tax=Tripterygium wilfordii TaxID=458696 RepID=A0A7J7C6C7_TRIWF|nr:hypothetical protein HS088_TW21G01562 [Tripterygium wilfordii]
MASNSRQLQRTLESAKCKSKCNSSEAKNPIRNNDDSNLKIDHRREAYHKSLDLNAVKQDVSLSEWQGYFPNLSQLESTLNDLIGDKALEELGRRCLAGSKTDVVGQRTNLDFTLALPAPVMRLQDKSPNRSNASWSSCQQLTLSLDKEGFETSCCIAQHGFPSLILMGCTHCYLYVMVSEMEPKCPNCQSSMLLDSFRGNAAQRSRL